MSGVLNLLKLLGAICGGAEAPPFQRASQQFFHSPLAASVLLAAVEPLPAQTQGAWAATGSMNVARELAASATLANARILVAGGKDFTTVFLSAEVLAPAHGR